MQDIATQPSTNNVALRDRGERQPGHAVLKTDSSLRLAFLFAAWIFLDDSELDAGKQSLGRSGGSYEFQPYNLLTLVHLYVSHARIGVMSSRWFDVSLKSCWKRKLHI